MQYIDMKPFEEFVQQRNLVDERHLPFYIKWVVRFLRSEFPSEARSAQDLLQCFPKNGSALTPFFKAPPALRAETDHRRQKPHEYAAMKRGGMTTVTVTQSSAFPRWVFSRREY